MKDLSYLDGPDFCDSEDPTKTGIRVETEEVEDKGNSEGDYEDLMENFDLDQFARSFLHYSKEVESDAQKIYFLRRLGFNGVNVRGRRQSLSFEAALSYRTEDDDSLGRRSINNMYVTTVEELKVIVEDPKAKSDSRLAQRVLRGR